MIWKEIKEFEGLYEASIDGRIRSVDRIGRCGKHGTLLYRGKELSPTIINSGYKAVALSKNGKPKSYLVHRLVASTFCDVYLDNKKEVNHIDGNKLNNHLDNLEWVTPSYNTKHGWNKRKQNAVSTKP